MIHVHRAADQPATRYHVDLGDRSITITNPKNRALYASCCGFGRCARNLTVQVYYDLHRYSCVAGKGCRK